MGYIIGGIILLVIVIWPIAIFNTFKKLIVRIEEAFATMDVYLKKRYDLIPNLIETVKGYIKHEKGTFEAVVEARNKSLTANNVNDKKEGENQLTQALGKLFALVENYPELKADTQFTNLSQNLSKIEDEIAKSRTYYNAVVRRFNTMCEVFPSMIIANIMKLESKQYFEVSVETERENVKVSF
jgi:LemA protein